MLKVIILYILYILISVFLSIIYLSYFNIFNFLNVIFINIVKMIFNKLRIILKKILYVFFWWLVSLDYFLY